MSEHTVDAAFDASLARALDPLVGEQRGRSWEDGVRVGRTGIPCAGVDSAADDTGRPESEGQ